MVRSGDRIGVWRQAVLRQAVLRQGVLRQGVLRQGVLRQAFATPARALSSGAMRIGGAMLALGLVATIAHLHGFYAAALTLCAFDLTAFLSWSVAQSAHCWGCPVAAVGALTMIAAWRVARRLDAVETRDAASALIAAAAAPAAQS